MIYCRILYISLSLYIYMCIYVYMYTYVYIYIYIYIYIYAYGPLPLPTSLARADGGVAGHDVGHDALLHLRQGLGFRVQGFY